jgi:hypothetical protein
MEVQINFMSLPIKKRQTEFRLARDTNGGRIYKAAYSKKEISSKNEGE